MFAIGIYDKRIDQLYLCRDRIGKKPLYYWYDGNNIVFASELKPIMKSPGFVPIMNKKVIGKFLFYQYIPEPQTIFENVYKVCPGEIVSFSHGIIKKDKYWSINSVTKNIKYEDAKSQLKEMLLESCKMRMVADVPVGVFLSGGIDSSLVAALTQSIKGNIKTFSIGFNEERFNEAKYAKDIAAHLGTEHKELYLDEFSMFEFVEDLPQYYDEPFADSSQIATMAVSKLSREDVTVAISGDGGDELFCGYNSYLDVLTNKKRIRQALFAKKILDTTGLKNSKTFRKLLPNNLNMFIDTYHKELGTVFWIGFYEQLLSNILDKEDYTNLNFDRIAYTDNEIFNQMLLDQTTYLPGDILCKVDRASMRYSQEVRSPLLDYRIIEFANSLPFEYKYKDTQKRILKDLVYDYIPKELLERPKRGFAVPVEKWLKNKFKDKVRTYSNINRLKKQEIFAPDAMNTFINNYFDEVEDSQFGHLDKTKIVWSFYILQDWMEYYGIS